MQHERHLPVEIIIAVSYWNLAIYILPKANSQIYHQNKLQNMEKYTCDLCGYVYDPEVGDPDNGIAPGTAFEDLPSNWTCPICGVDKSSFSKK